MEASRKTSRYEVSVDRLDSVLGQASTLSSLRHMLATNTLPSTVLFFGPKGVGKSYLATRLAEELINRTTTNSTTRYKLDHAAHPDIRHIYPEGKSQLHSMQAIKQMIDDVATLPYEAGVKVFIVHDAHRMLPSSANALLKTLEEPPKYAYIILLSSEIAEVIPTIVSRCFRFSLQPQLPKNIAVFLEKQGIEAKEAMRIALLSQGSLDKAVQLTEKKSNAALQSVLALLTSASNGSLIRMMPAIQAIEKHFGSDKKEDADDELASQTGFSEEDLFLHIFYWYRDLHLLSQEADPKHLFFFDHKETLEKMLKSPLPSLEKVGEEIQKCSKALQSHLKLKSILQNLFLALR